MRPRLPCTAPRRAPPRPRPGPAATGGSPRTAPRSHGPDATSAGAAPRERLLRASPKAGRGPPAPGAAWGVAALPGAAGSRAPASRGLGCQVLEISPQRCRTVSTSLFQWLKPTFVEARREGRKSQTGEFLCFSVSPKSQCLGSRSSWSGSAPQWKKVLIAQKETISFMKFIT